MSIALTLKSYIFDKHSNENIMRRYVITGDQTLLSKLYDANGNDLYHFIMTLSDATLAKDICQKTWLKVIEKKHLYQNTGQFKAWLFTIARNQLMDDFRAFQNTINDTECLVESLGKTHNKEDRQHLNDCFDQALLAIAFEQREAFCLQQEGFSLEDIAKITHTGQETVKSRLRYARDGLRKRLEKFHEDQFPEDNYD
ncbi:sigma-70 family RNA polymerase sigma factor [Paraglaciecola sp. L3A3]|uniref:sigma-70 family RNA polymerase sigma factor n=1 Tax=Paraglaciecola sp. L3A3 TaxID=2686358 RepID=UPI001E2ED54D|nr:sigma-70 family RNA polymerase sigma factor [Paraglaciecola sp. L3A3]